MHGTLTRPDGRTPVAGQPVRIQVRALHGTTWKTVVTRTSRADGTITARPVIYGSSYVRAAFPGTPGWVGSMSGATKVVAY